MPKTRPTPLPVDTLVEVYKLYYLHRSTEYIKEQTHVGGMPSAIVKSLERYARGEMKNTRMDSNYPAAVIYLQKEGYLKESILYVNEKKQQKEIQEIVKPLSTDPYANLQAAFDSFTQALGDFVEQELHRRTVDLQTELDSNKESLGLAQERIEELTVVANENKNSNWVNGLKKRFA